MHTAMKKYRVYRLNSTHNGTDKSFEKEFTNGEEAAKYCTRQRELLTEREGYDEGAIGESMMTFFLGRELKVVLVYEVFYE